MDMVNSHQSVKDHSRDDDALSRRAKWVVSAYN